MPKIWDDNDAVTLVELTLHAASDLKNVKMFGHMTPCAVLTVPGCHEKVITDAPRKGGTNPEWDQTFLLHIPDVIIPHIDPRPSVKIELFDSPKFAKPLGSATVQLGRALAFYHQAYTYRHEVILKGKPQGIVRVTVSCGRPSFAPDKDSPQFEQYADQLLPPQPAQRASPLGAVTSAPGTYMGYPLGTTPGSRRGGSSKSGY